MLLLSFFTCCCSLFYDECEVNCVFAHAELLVWLQVRSYGHWWGFRPIKYIWQQNAHKHIAQTLVWNNNSCMICSIYIILKKLP
jgi:hypothetical protein